MKLYELTSNRSRMLRYLQLSIRTLKVIREERPSVIFVQNPSIILSFLTILLRPFFKFKVIVDCHNSGLYPLEGQSRVLSEIANWIAKNADLTIVTNAALASDVIEKGGRAYVMPDPLPTLHAPNDVLEIQHDSALFICTWASDEPYSEVIDAVRGLGLTLYVTGNYRKVFSEEQLKELSQNVVLLGFVDRETYDAYLNSVDLVIDLTTRESCLVCGAYEAVAAEKPMIISDTEINRNVFNLGAMYSGSNVTSIRECIREALLNLEELREQTAHLKVQRMEDTKLSVEELRTSIGL